MFNKGPPELPGFIAVSVCITSGIEKDGKPLFPGSQFAASDRPLFNFERPGGKWRMITREPGDYTLHWADGEVQTLTTTDEIMKLPISGNWTVHFDPAWGGPKTIVFDSLKSWTAFADEGIKYYSGSAVYDKVFKMKKKQLKQKRVALDLGNLHEMAVVNLNGHRFSLCWAPPYKLDVTDYLRSGKNDLKIEITNLWPNRLIGDGRLPQNERLTRTNISKFDAGSVQSLMRESGHHPEIADLLLTVIETRRAAYRRVLNRAIAHHELGPDVDQEFIVDLLIGPLWTRLLITRQPVTHMLVDEVVDVVLRAYPPPAGAEPG